MQRLRSSVGLSLVEAMIILTIIGTLSAVLAPTLNNYLQDAKRTKARKDCEAIASALGRVLTDVGEAWLLRDGNGSAATDPPLHTSGNRVDLIVTTGMTPVLGLARSSGSPDWTATVDNGSVQELSHHLVLNTPSNASGNRYRIPTDMTVGFDPTSGAQFNSEFAWRGPYLSGGVGPDPWGMRYAVNVEFLAKALGAGPSGNTNDVFVLSAGGNLKTDTRFDTSETTALVDDILYVVSGGTR